MLRLLIICLLSGELLRACGGNPTQPDIKQGLGKISNEKKVLLEDHGVISMSDCIKDNNIEAERHICDWLIHIENGSSVAADIYVDIPVQPPEDNCVHCFLEYGYVNHLKERVLSKRTCQQNYDTKYHSKSSLWLKFSCLGSKAHHQLNWTNDDGNQMKGFTLEFSVSEEQSKVVERGWDLPSVFTLTVVVLSAMVLLCVGLILQRSCKRQSIQRNLQESRHKSIHGPNSRIRNLIRNTHPHHRRGLHEKFYKEMLARKYDPENLISTICADKPVLNFDEAECDNLSPPLNNHRTSRAMQRVTKQPLRDRSPTRSNHTYVSITHLNPNSSGSETDSEQLTDNEGAEQTTSTDMPSSQSHLSPWKRSRSNRKPKGRNGKDQSKEKRKSVESEEVRVINSAAVAEPVLDEETQSKLLTAPKYTSPKLGNIPHIILTRASTRRRNTSLDIENEQDGHKFETAIQNIPDTSTTSSLPDLSKQTPQEQEDYHSAGFVGGSTHAPHNKELIVTPRTLAKDFSTDTNMHVVSVSSHL